MSGIRAVVFSSDNRRVAARTKGPTGEVVIGGFDTQSGSPLFDLDDGTIKDLDFSPDLTRIVSTNERGVVTLRDGVSGAELLQVSAGPESDVLFLPKGDRIAAGSGSRSGVRVHAHGIDALIEAAKARAKRSLTDEECQEYLHVPEFPSG